MNMQNEAVLSGVCPGLGDKVRLAIKALENENTYVLVVSGLRTGSQQQALYAQGRSAPGHIVTNARAGFSMHNYGFAVDIVPYRTGQSGTLNWNPATPQFQRMVSLLKTQGLEWGGDWKVGLGDFDHFQMTGLPVSPTVAMRTDFAADEPTAGSNLKGIWLKAQAMAYAA